ncbi:MAG TPA: radical SAM family heme chaperone HemW [Candidatus Saccharimonadales bacterium]|nr:radical SAM family heme chaperone HemW [Candidatus Saccharimonadales bacterium]
MAVRQANPVSGLYVHVPFCAHKCEYCAFYSEASSGQTIQRYVDALCREMELTADDLKPRTIFFGGGTPSILNLRQWEQILKTMEGLNLVGATEWTIESNPATVSLDKARLWKSFGVNRVSMGVQSLDVKLLERLGRIHSREMVFKSFDTLRQAGFENINVDLMFAIPGQSMEIWKSTLDEAMELGSEHLSCYEVIYEEDTPLYEQLQAGQFSVDEDLACAMYEELVLRSSAEGYHQYEIANFARGDLKFDPSLADIVPTYACRHNMTYWRAGDYYGLGPSAAGYVRGQRTKNWSNTILYCEQLEKGKRAIESTEELSPLRRAGETAAFGLRMNAGWPLDEFRRVTGYELRSEWSSEIKELVTQNWAQLEPDRFRLTPEGLRRADYAAELFLR